MKSGERDAALQRIEQFIARYGHAFNAFLAVECCHGANPDSLLKTLKRDRIHTETLQSQYPGGDKKLVYHLLASAPTPSRETFTRDTALLFFCFNHPHDFTRLRITFAEFQALFPAETFHPNTRPYVIEHNDAVVRILEIYTLETFPPVHRVKERLEQYRAFPTLTQAIDAREFGFGILALRPELLPRLEKELQPLRDRVYLTLETVPSVDVLRQELQRYEAHHAAKKEQRHAPTAS